jgi:DNA transformation protein and related proteins
MDREFLGDLFARFGPVTIRPMFSGFGISADGVNFALALRAGLFFRADEHTIPGFEAEGSKPFSYQTSTRSVTVASYWEVPARLFDDIDEFGEWARSALAAAQRAALTKRAKPRKAIASGKTGDKSGKPQPRSVKTAKKTSSPAKAGKDRTKTASPSKGAAKRGTARKRSGKSAAKSAASR